MKFPFNLGPLALALALASLAGCATPAVKGGGTVTVQFEEGANFTDFGASPDGNPYAAAQERRQLEDVLIELADTYIPEGCNVRLSFSDLDRAGQIPPLAPRRIRVVSDSFPARAVFQYHVTDAAGEAVQHGSETLFLAFPQFTRRPNTEDRVMPDLEEMFRPWFQKLGRQLPRTRPAP
jgi:hypothetical protein